MVVYVKVLQIIFYLHCIGIWKYILRTVIHIVKQIILMHHHGDDSSPRYFLPAPHCPPSALVLIYVERIRIAGEDAQNFQGSWLQHNRQRSPTQGDDGCQH